MKASRFCASSLALSASVACGAGLESIHESDFRFEHCYRLDMDPEIAPSHRYHCWVDWTRSYAHGQSRDRVEYARRRILTMEAGDTALVTVYGAPTRRQRVFVVGDTEPQNVRIAAPAPTSTHKPPPPTAPLSAPSAAAGSDTASTVPSAPDLPGAACAKECETPLKTCQESCGNEAQCTRCREDYRDCMERCYQ